MVGLAVLGRSERQSASGLSDLVPLRCGRCGNAVLRARLEHEDCAREVITSDCPECDTGGDTESIFYTCRDTGDELPYVLYMERHHPEALGDGVVDKLLETR